MYLSDNSNKQPINILERSSDNICINIDTIIINLVTFHFSPDIKDKCLEILKTTQLDNDTIKFFYRGTTIYGICIPYIPYKQMSIFEILTCDIDMKMCVSELVSDIDGEYYLT
jgi:hypothetical protein